MAIIRRQFREHQTSPGLVELHGRFGVNLAGAITPTQTRGVTIVRQGAGLYDITPGGIVGGAIVLGAFVSCATGTPSNQRIPYVTAINTTTGTVSVTLVPPGTMTPTDPTVQSITLLYRLILQNPRYVG